MFGFIKIGGHLLYVWLLHEIGGHMLSWRCKRRRRTASARAATAP
jgi:hypothetical protein